MTDTTATKASLPQQLEYFGSTLSRILVGIATTQSEVSCGGEGIARIVPAQLVMQWLKRFT